MARELPSAQFQDGVIGLLKREIEFDSSMWGTGSFSNKGLTVHAIHLHEQPREMIENWQLVNHEDTVAYEGAKRLGQVLNVHTPSLFRGKRKAGIRDHARRYEMANGLVTAYVQPDMPLYGWISLYRSDPDFQFADQERAQLELLMPHVVEALTTNRIINLDRIYLARKEGRGGLAIVDRRGSIHHAEAEFSEVIAAEWPGFDGKILPAALAAALSTGHTAAFRGSQIVVELRADGDLYFLKARRLVPLDKLTAREMQVADAFSRGSSYKEVARILQISPVTVRNYLQAIYAKLGVTDKAELAYLFAQWR